MKMSDPCSPKIETSLLTQCLDFSRQLMTNLKPFKIEVKTSSGFSFNFSNMDQEPAKSMAHEVKKKSTLRRNAARKQKFLEDRKQTSKTSFRCEQCDHKANCKVSLRKHIGKEHKTIPQLDGFEDIKSVTENFSQTESINVKEIPWILQESHCRLKT